MFHKHVILSCIKLRNIKLREKFWQITSKVIISSFLLLETRIIETQ